MSYQTVYFNMSLKMQETEKLQLMTAAGLALKVSITFRFGRGVNAFFSMKTGPHNSPCDLF